MKTRIQKMRNNRQKLEKARDIADPAQFYAEQDGRMGALNVFLASGRRLDDSDGFIDGGMEVTLVMPDCTVFKYSGREYNRALAAHRSMKAKEPPPPVFAQTSPEPKHQTVWYKPSTWF